MSDAMSRKNLRKRSSLYG